jgi:hypothetical protein
LIVAIATDGAQSSFASGVECVRLGELAAARACFAEHLRCHPSDSKASDIIARLDALGAVVPTHGRRSYDRFTVDLSAGRRVSVLTPHEGPNACDSSGTQIWSGAPVLLNWLKNERKERLQGSHVLELGSGTGLVGCGIAKLGASNVCLSDLPQLMPLLLANVKANAADAATHGCDLTAQPLVWGARSSVVETTPWDTIVAASVCYDEQLVAPLATTIRSLLTAQRSSTVLLALSDLRHFGYTAPDYSRLLEALDGFSVQRLASIDPSPIQTNYAGQGGTPSRPPLCPCAPCTALLQPNSTSVQLYGFMTLALTAACA